MKRGLLILPLIALGACVSAPQELSQQASTQTLSLQYGQNYQEVYRRISSTARRCIAGGIGFSLGASLVVDAELYSELGYGEIQMSLSNVGTRNYYWTARVEKISSGALVTIVSGNTLRNETWLNKVKAWADGSEEC